MRRSFAIGVIVFLITSPALSQSKKDAPKSKLDPKWVEQVAALKPDDQVTAVTAKMSEFNPGFNGPLTHKIADNAVVEVKFDGVYVTDLSPLRAFEKLKKFECDGATKIADLSPLRGLKLATIRIANAPALSDLTPLKDMPLESIQIDWSSVKSLAPLQKMTTLRVLTLDQGGLIGDLKPLEGLPLTRLSVYGSTNIREAKFLKGMPLKYLRIESTSIADISALKGMELEILETYGSKVVEYGVIQGMPIRTLSVNRASDMEMKKLFREMPLESLSIYEAAGVTDLTPLAGKKLTYLVLRNGSFKDLKALQGMKFFHLDLSNCAKLVDIAALKGMSCFTLILTGTSPKDFAPLEKISAHGLNLSKCKSLKSLKFLEGATIGILDIDETPIADLSPLAAVKSLMKLRCAKTLVKEFSPLKNTAITDLDCDIKGPNDIAALKAIKTLKKLNGKPAAEILK